MTAVAVVCLAVAPAAADGRAVDDPDDTGGRLDVLNISHAHVEMTSGQSLLRHVVRTYEAWDNSAFNNEGRPFPTRMRLSFNLDLDPFVERTLEVAVTQDGNLYATMFGHKAKRESAVRGYARVARPDDYSIELVFPKSLLKRGLETYRWRLQTQFDDPEDPNCGDTGTVYVICTDNAPDQGWVKHRLSGAGH